MNCTEFESAVEFAVESRRPLPAAAQEHTESCESCRLTWMMYQRLDDAIGAWRSVQPPADLADAVLMDLMTATDHDHDALVGSFDDVSDSEVIRAMEFDRPAKPNRRKSRLAGLALLSPVACLIAVVLLMNFASTRRSVHSFDDVASDDGSSSTKFAEVDSRPDVSSTISDVLSVVRSEYDEVASDTKTAAIEVVNSIPPLAMASTRADGQNSDSGDEPSGQNWNPISSRVRVAMGFLWKAVPSDNQSN